MKILVTAGPTREPIDAVRFISNRSTGKMGYAAARAAVEHGHDVVLVSGPVFLSPPRSVRVINVVTAEQMLGAVRDNIDWCDALIMAAAVSDWRPANAGSGKLKKDELRASLPIEETSDILKSIAGRKGRRVYVGFAAEETDNLLAEARRKLAGKGLDLIVANDISQPDSGFEADTNRVVLISADGSTRKLPLMTKDRVAEQILEWVEKAVCAE